MQIARRIAGGDNVTYNPGLLSKTVENIQEKVIAGYGKDFPDIVYNSPDYEALRHLTQNVYQFSAAKNYQQLKDITLSLQSENGLRTEAEFVEKVRAMNLKYNADWLRTERNTAIASGQMAARWVEFEENKDVAQILEYNTIGDGNVRPGHAALDRVRKPKNHLFWKTYYPPNGWGCRCDVVSVLDNEATPTPDERIDAPEIDPMFRTNLAEQGVIFPKGHPYFAGIPKPELRKAISYLPPENSYHAVRSVSKQKIDVHILHNNAELPGNLAVADDLAKQGYRDVHLLPDLHEKDAHLRAKFLPEGYAQGNIKKNPDACIVAPDGRQMVCDFKIITSDRNFSKRIAEAAEQAEYAVIKLNYSTTKLGEGAIIKRINNKIMEKENLKGVIVLDQDGRLLYEYFREG